MEQKNGTWGVIAKGMAGTLDSIKDLTVAQPEKRGTVCLSLLFSSEK